jgi:hypothetical protein
MVIFVSLQLSFGDFPNLGGNILVTALKANA